MKFDITRLPVGEAITGLLLAVLAVTFIGAFSVVGGDDGADADDVVDGSPTPTAGPGETPPPDGDGIAVIMGDNFFDPNEVTVAAGATVTFNLTNEGIAIHNMRVAGLDGEYSTDDDAVSDPGLVMGGGTATVTWTAPDQVGEIIFRCDFHPIEMIGTITVQ
jgi:plastocyanin